MQKASQGLRRRVRVMHFGSLGATSRTTDLAEEETKAVF